MGRSACGELCRFVVSYTVDGWAVLDTHTGELVATFSPELDTVRAELWSFILNGRYEHPRGVPYRVPNVVYCGDRKQAVYEMTRRRHRETHDIPAFAGRSIGLARRPII